MLRLEALCCGYGPFRALHDLDLEVGRGEILALLGPNGAGKSSTLLCLAGHVERQGGRILLEGEEISALAPQQRVKRGLALSPEGRRLFPDLTVAENLAVGGLSRPKARLGPNREKVLESFPRLAERLSQPAGRLSGGEQQMLAIGRALMAEPKVLLIDELSLGLMPKVVDVCYEVLQVLARKDGLAVLVVEQNTAKALSLADRVAVLASGQSVWSGSGADARAQADVIEEAILGGTAPSV